MHGNTEPTLLETIDGVYRLRLAFVVQAEKWMWMANLKYLDNYNKPYEVRWLCKNCHENEHHLNEEYSSGE